MPFNMKFKWDFFSFSESTWVFSYRFDNYVGEEATCMYYHAEFLDFIEIGDISDDTGS